MLLSLIKWYLGQVFNMKGTAEYLFDDAGAVLLQLLRVLFDDADGVGEPGQSAAYLVVNTGDLTA